MVNCIKKLRLFQTEEGGKKLPSPQKRICNSAASSPNYSGALLKSATRQKEREKKKRQMEGEKDMRKGAESKSEGKERVTSFCK